MLQSSKIFIFLCIILLTGCNRYDVKLNNQTLYSPPGLFSGYSVKDAQFKECIRATIQEQKITKASQLKRLECPNASIQNVSGVGVFEQLEILNLKNNGISNPNALGALTLLTHLNLAQNKIKDVSFVSSLEKLQWLDLQENEELNCQNLKEVANRANVKVTLPTHCKH